MLKCNYLTRGEFATIFAASPYWPLWNNCWYRFTYKLSAPGSLDPRAWTQARYCWESSNYGLLVDIDAEDLTFLVDSNDTVCRLVFRGHKDSLTRNMVRVHISARLEIIEMNEAVFDYLKPLLTSKLPELRERTQHHMRDERSFIYRTILISSAWYKAECANPGTT